MEMKQMFKTNKISLNLINTKQNFNNIILKSQGHNSNNYTRPWRGKLTFFINFWSF